MTPEEIAAFRAKQAAAKQRAKEAAQASLARAKALKPSEAAKKATISRMAADLLKKR